MRIALAATIVGMTPATSSAADEAPCVADVRKLRADAVAGAGRIRACLEEREAALSAPCRARREDPVRDIGAMAATCRFDVARFCDDVTPGGARVVACRERHRDDLWSSSRAAGFGPRERGTGVALAGFRGVAPADRRSMR